MKLLDDRSDVKNQLTPFEVGKDLIRIIKVEETINTVAHATIWFAETSNLSVSTVATVLLPCNQVSACEHCGKASVCLRRCSRCLQVGYCDQVYFFWESLDSCFKECQTSNWKQHRRHCSKPKHVRFPVPLFANLRAAEDPQLVLQTKLLELCIGLFGTQIEPLFAASEFCYQTLNGSKLHAVKKFDDPVHLSCQWRVPDKNLLQTVQRLQLPSPTGGDENAPSHETLMDALSLFEQPEVLTKENAWHCPKCKTGQEAIKTMTICRLPKLLVIHMKRFDWANNFKRRKLDQLILFPQMLDMATYVALESDKTRYRLIGVVNHMGPFGNGHYTAYVKHAGKASFCKGTLISLKLRNGGMHLMIRRYIRSLPKTSLQRTLMCYFMSKLKNNEVWFARLDFKVVFELRQIIITRLDQQIHLDEIKFFCSSNRNFLS